MKQREILRDMKGMAEAEGKKITDLKLCLVKILAGFTRDGIRKTIKTYSLTEELARKIVSYYYDEAESMGLLLWRSLSKEKIISMDERSMGKEDEKEILFLRERLINNRIK